MLPNFSFNLLKVKVFNNCIIIILFDDVCEPVHITTILCEQMLSAKSCLEVID